MPDSRQGRSANSSVSLLDKFDEIPRVSLQAAILKQMLGKMVLQRTFDEAISLQHYQTVHQRPYPGRRRLRVIGLMLRANKDARRAYAEMIRSSEFQSPMRWDAVREGDFDGLLLGGGHRARGMRQYLESPVLQALVAAFFAADKPVAAICHGVLLAARSKRADGRSILHGRKTTALTWKQEKTASAFAHVGRAWDRDYYRTYIEAPGEPEGLMSIEAEVRRALASADDFVDVPRGTIAYGKKMSGLSRDTATDSAPAWVVTDGRYVSARWPGDAHSFAAAFDRVLRTTAPSTLCAFCRGANKLSALGGGLKARSATHAAQTDTAKPVMGVGRKSAPHLRH